MNLLLWLNRWSLSGRQRIRNTTGGTQAKGQQQALAKTTQVDLLLFNSDSEAWTFLISLWLVILTVKSVRLKNPWSTQPVLLLLPRYKGQRRVRSAHCKLTRLQSGLMLLKSFPDWPFNVSDLKWWTSSSFQAQRWPNFLVELIIPDPQRSYWSNQRDQEGRQRYLWTNYRAELLQTWRVWQKVCKTVLFARRCANFSELTRGANTNSIRAMSSKYVPSHRVTKLCADYEVGWRNYQGRGYPARRNTRPGGLHIHAWTLLL